MRGNRLVSLMLKDLRLHGRGILLAQAGFLLLLLLLIRVMSQSYPKYSDAARATLVYNMNFLAASFLWGDWLISREKMKGTFAWLRSMPLSDQTIIRSKLILGCSCCAILWITSTSLFSAHFFFQLHWPLWWLVLTGLLCFTVLSFTTRMILTQKAGFLVPIGIAALLLLPLFGSTYLNFKSFHPTADMMNPSIEWLGCAGLGVLAMIIWSFLEMWTRMAETPQLLE